MASGETIRVLIVDDSAIVRALLSSVIAKDQTLELVGSLANGRTALEKLDVLRPDVVVLDVEMPEMDGLETLAAIRARCPRLPVIMFSAHTEVGAAITIEALSRGAADYVAKPAGDASAETALTWVREQLLSRIKLLGSGRRPPKTAAAARDSLPESSPGSRERPAAVELVCIVSSTGGPQALETVLVPLPAEFPLPIVIVQHMPPAFTRHLAQRLSTQCAIRVREAVAGESLQAGVALMAPGDYHLVVRSRGAGGLVMTNQAAPENSCRPSADVLLRSAAEAFGKHTLAVVLTGMGQDGLAGCQQVRAAGGQVIVQDEATSVVWGMAGAVARAGLANLVLPIENVAADILSRVRTHETHSRR